MKSKMHIIFASMIFVALPMVCSAFFSDIDKDNIYYQPIFFLQSNNLIVGYPDNTYKSNEYLTRSIAAKVVLSAYEYDEKYKLDIPELDPGMEFMDSTYDSWFAKYMIKAGEFGVLGKDSDGYLKPENAITRSEFMKLILEPAGLDLESYDDKQIYSDVPEYAWFAKYMNFAGMYGLAVADRDENLRPSELVNRGEAAESGYLLYLMLKKDKTDMVLQELQANIDQTIHYLNIGKDFAARRSAAIAIGLGQNLYDTDPKNKVFLAYAKLAKANAYSVNYHILNQVKSPDAQAWLDLAKNKIEEALSTDIDSKTTADQIQTIW